VPQNQDLHEGQLRAINRKSVVEKCYGGISSFSQPWIDDWDRKVLKMGDVARGE
jgi:hypothetical protein